MGKLLQSTLMLGMLVRVGARFVSVQRTMLTLSRLIEAKAAVCLHPTPTKDHTQHARRLEPH